MATPDSLLVLAQCRHQLRAHGLGSLALSRGSRRREWAALYLQEETVAQLVERDDPDVIRALFAPAEPIDWDVQVVAAPSGLRQLVLTYRVDGGDRPGEGERRAWRAVKAALSQ